MPDLPGVGCHGGEHSDRFDRRGNPPPFLCYALSVITSPALPDVRDGLKPVQRRILYTMYHDLHLHADGRPRKCAKIVGDVMGNYHPHGDAAVYDALVRMAQDWVHARAAGPWAGQLRLRRWRPAGRRPLHRGQADRRWPTA